MSNISCPNCKCYYYNKGNSNACYACGKLDIKSLVEEIKKAHPRIEYSDSDHIVRWPFRASRGR